MDVYKNRYNNIRRHMDLKGGISITELSRQYGKSQGYLNNILGNKPIRNIGEKVARSFEEFFELPHGNLDKEHTTPDTRTNKDKVKAYIAAYDDLMLARRPDGWLGCVQEISKCVSVWHVDWERKDGEIQSVEFDLDGRALNARARNPNRVAEARDAYVGWLNQCH